MPEDMESPSSWNESRRLIVSQLRDMNGSLKELSTKIDTMNEKSRDRITLLDASVALQLSDMKIRISMLEVRAKIWGGMIGAVGGSVAAFVLFLLEKGLK